MPTPICFPSPSRSWLLPLSGCLRWLGLLTLSASASIATNLGVNYKRVVIQVLALVSVLMAVSTSLVGPMTFLGFLVATLTYQACDTYDHRRLLPMSIVMCYAVLTGAYFIMNNFFHAQGLFPSLLSSWVVPRSCGSS